MRTVDGMNLLHPSPPAHVLQLTLAPDQPVMLLHCRAGQRASLEVLSGRLWLTQQGRSEDLFLQAGQGLTLQGPAVLYAGADGTTPLRLRWVQEAGALPTQPARLSAA
jgi:hypothetical protein